MSDPGEGATSNLARSPSDPHPLTYRLVSAQFTVIGPAGPIVALLGKEITLPCDLYPLKNVEHVDIKWYRVVQSNIKFHEGENVTRKQLIEYTGRIDLLKDDNHEGSVALKIHHVRVSDEGEYQCVLQDDSFQKTTTVELKVAAWGSDPQIHVKPLKDGEILLLCQSNGWYPKPQVGWKDIQGENLPSLSESQSQDGEDLFQTETSLVVQSNSTEDVFCFLQHPLLEEQKIVKPPPRVSFFLRKCVWVVAFAAGFLIVGLFILGCIYCIWKRRCAKGMIGKWPPGGAVEMFLKLKACRDADDLNQKL
ncbi:butyrophilin subfamily 1 member A1-like [Monodelphis domestica]|uniref:butyrophilin subfamily 1 member A1-like n=1 Tax=Monodelphis domestica TaxID=13616 RepID=UPI0024E241A2|nr:butyrophilin subfamily 1 member A1-like [Monodelphis domestica]